MQHSVHICSTEILEAKDALNVVECKENAVHAPHTDLKGILEQRGPSHVVELALI